MLWTICFQFTNPSSQKELAAFRASKRFAFIRLHTNMQVWALGPGIALELQGLTRFMAARLSCGRELSKIAVLIAIGGAR